MKTDSSLVIACGALAKEILVIKERLNLSFDVCCLNASFHNTPDVIPEKVEKAILTHQDQYSRIFIAYGDCGTGGRLDATISKYGVERLAGAHCYSFYLGGDDAFLALQEEELGTFYLTDFLAKHFDRLILKEMGIDDDPSLISIYFSNYKRLVYLRQSQEVSYEEEAKKAASILGLSYEVCFCGDKHLAEHLVHFNKGVKGGGICN